MSVQIYKDIRCPTCQIINDRMGLPSFIKCLGCQTEIGCAKFKYCNECSKTLKRCSKCGNGISNGNDYLPIIKEIYEKKVPDISKHAIDENTSTYVKAYLASYEKKYLGMVNGIKDKNADEVINFLMSGSE